MSSPIPSRNLLYDAFVEAKIPLPDEVVSIDIKAVDDGLVQLYIVCNLTGPMLHRLGAAMQVLAVKDRLDGR